MEQTSPYRRRLFWSWHSGAAVCAGVILLLGLGWIFLPADDLNISRSGNDRCAGTVLILGNGELIDLGKRQERVVDAGKGTKIRIGENVVSGDRRTSSDTGNEYGTGPPGK